jgi:CheY-like chemotaxis protein
VLSFLVADPAPEQSLLLLNVLENRGHNVTVVATGQATLDATGVTVGSTANGSFDSILVSCALDAATLDILQTLRLLRSGNVKLPIVAYCTDSSVARSALEAGANNFLVEPNLSGSGDRATFEAFASSVLELLNLPAGNLVVNSITPAPAGTNLSFTGAIFGSAISLSGTALSLNSILRSIFYFAPQGVTGEDSVTFTVQDYPHPEACQLVVVAEPAYAALSGVPGPPVCDASTRNVVSASLRVIVIAVNHAPAISTAAPTFTAVIDESTAVPTLVVTDSDFSSSTTATATPVMSVLVTVSYGVVSFPTLQGLSLSAGQGFADRVAALNGPLLRINAALAAMQYTCRAADFCSSAGADSVSVRADDNGFTGTGGALTATATVTVNVVAA